MTVGAAAVSRKKQKQRTATPVKQTTGEGRVPMFDRTSRLAATVPRKIYFESNPSKRSPLMSKNKKKKKSKSKKKKKHGKRRKRN